jgi:hypothetical protein
LMSTRHSVVSKIRICPLKTQSEVVIIRSGLSGYEYPR